MNYIYEINAFYDWLIENSVSANAQALWHLLMSYCNNFGWKDEFTLSNTKLIDGLKITRQSMDRARNELIQKSRVTYRKGTSYQCGYYSILPFCVREEGGNSDRLRTECGLNADRLRTESVPLNKLKLNINETKKDTNVSKEKSEPAGIFANRTFSGKMQGKLNEWLLYKKQKKESYVPMGLTMFLTEVENNLKEYDEDDVCRLIDTCMAKNWKGIIWDILKESGAGKQGGNIDLEDFIERPEGKNV